MQGLSAQCMRNHRCAQFMAYLRVLLQHLCRNLRITGFIRAHKTDVSAGDDDMPYSERDQALEEQKRRHDTQDDQFARGTGSI